MCYVGGHGKGGWGVAGTEVDPQEIMADIAAENEQNEVEKVRTYTNTLSSVVAFRRLASIPSPPFPSPLTHFQTAFYLRTRPSSNQKNHCFLSW